MMNIKDILNKIQKITRVGVEKVKTVWESAKGRAAVLTGGSVVAAVIIVAVVLSNIATAQDTHFQVAGTGTSSSESSSSASSAVSSSVSSAEAAVSSAESAASVAVSVPSSEASAAPTTTTVAQASVAVTDISITKSGITIQQGATYQLTAVITPSTASDKSLNWTSTDTSIATVDGNGVVTGKTAGSATIHASGANGHRGSCKVTVKAPVTGNGNQGAGNDNNNQNDNGGTQNDGGGQAGGVPANYNDPNKYPGTDETLYFNDDITPSIKQKVSFKGVGAGHDIVGAGGAYLSTTADYGAKYTTLNATIKLTGPRPYNGNCNISRDGSQAGNLTFGSLTPGNYTLETKAEDGTPVARIHFTVNPDGTVS